MEFLINRSLNFLLENKSILFIPFTDLCKKILPDQCEKINQLQIGQTTDFNLFKEVFICYILESYKSDEISTRKILLNYLLEMKESKEILLLIKRMSLEMSIQLK